MLASLFGLLNVLLFLNFVLAFFAVLGVNLLQGSQYRACRQSSELQYITDSNGKEVPIWPKIEPFKLCNADSDCQTDNPDAVCGSLWDDYKLDPKLYDGVE